MDQQVPSSVPPTAEGLSPSLTPEQVEEMKRIAKERAIQQMLAQNGPVARTPVQRQPMPSAQPKVVYVKRPLTVAEYLLIFLLSCGIVTGGQLIWQGISNFLPRVEIRMK